MNGDADETNGIAPRPKMAIAAREMLVGLVVLCVGAYMILAWAQHPDGHTARRLAVGAAAVAVGVAVAVLSFGRSCSACGHRLQTFSFQAASGRVPGLEQALAGGDGAGVARLLGDALVATPGDGAMSCSFAYCDGCRRLLMVDVKGGTEGRRAKTIAGVRAAAVVPAIERIASERSATG